MPSHWTESLPPQAVSFGNCKFFKVCESVSVMQSSLCPFFRIHMLSDSIWHWCLIVWLTQGLFYSNKFDHQECGSSVSNNWKRFISKLEKVSQSRLRGKIGKSPCWPWEPPSQRTGGMLVRLVRRLKAMKALKFVTVYFQCPGSLQYHRNQEYIFRDLHLLELKILNVHGLPFRWLLWN